MFQNLILSIAIGITSHLWSDPIPLFTPPPKWQYAQPKNPSEYVQISFVSEGSAQFRPSINLALEETDVSLKEYVKAVKEIHLQDPQTKWRDLGKFTMKGGIGRLTEMTTQMPVGEVKILQAILIHEKIAYILTITALKKDYPNRRQEMLQALQSLSIYDNLFAALSDPTKQAKIKDFFATLGIFSPNENFYHAKQKQWELLQKEVLEGCSEMGGHWHYLALKEGLSKIQGTP